jgi:Zn-dependent peptidase ImmA (M78 family)/DNA-binding XRE family transcriptional regulator
MTGDSPNRDDAPADDEVLDEPPVRYGGTDALIEFADGARIDLNATPDPFSGELPRSKGLTALQMPGEDPDALGRARIGRRLKALREDSGLSKKEVAERAGIGATRVTQVERGEVAFGMSLFVSLVRAMGGRVPEVAAPDAPEVSMRALVKIGETAGAQRPVLERIGAIVGRQRFPDALIRAYGWTQDALFAGEPRSPRVGAQVAFNARPGMLPPDDSPTLALARTLSVLSASLYEKPFAGVPADPRELRLQVLEDKDKDNGDVTLDALLEWAWSAGIIVLPLAKGNFGAAVWFAEDVPVVVLQEPRTFAAYWLFDLAHELAHLALGHVATRGILDVGELKDRDTRSVQEREANTFALELLLPASRTLVAEVRRRTANDAPGRFKFAVRDVAREQGVSAGVLGFVAARAMSDVPADKDRWGSASNLARDEDPDGRARVEAAFRARIDPNRLQQLDGALLRAVALSA